MGYPPIRRPLPHPTHHHRLSRVLTGRDDAERGSEGGDRHADASQVDLDRLAVNSVRVLAMDAIHKAGAAIRARPWRWPPRPPMCCGPGSCGSTRSTRSGSTGTGSCSRPATRGAAVCGVALDRVPAGRPGPQAAAPVGAPDPGPPRVRAHGHAAVVATVHGADGGAECRLSCTRRRSGRWLTRRDPKAGCKASGGNLARAGPHHPGGRATPSRARDSSQRAAPVLITC
jgi:hypothetical protein